MNDGGSTTSSSDAFWDYFVHLFNANISATNSANTELLRQNMARTGFSDSFVTDTLGQGLKAPADLSAPPPPTIRPDTGGTTAQPQPAGLTTTTTGSSTGTGTSSGTNSGGSSGAQSQSGNTIGTGTTNQSGSSATYPGFWDIFLHALNGGSNGLGNFIGSIFNPSGW